MYDLVTGYLPAEKAGTADQANTELGNMFRYDYLVPRVLDIYIPSNLSDVARLADGIMPVDYYAETAVDSDDGDEK